MSEEDAINFDNTRSEISVEDVSTTPVSPCGCGGDHGDAESTEGAYADPSNAPVIDARAIPHAARHATVFAAFAAVEPEASMILVAPHDPLPLLRQLSERETDNVHVAYEVNGPDFWRLRLTRQG